MRRVLEKNKKSIESYSKRGNASARCTINKSTACKVVGFPPGKSTDGKRLALPALLMELVARREMRRQKKTVICIARCSKT